MIFMFGFFFVFFKQKTAYEMRIRDWSSDVCSSDLDLYGGGSPVTAPIKVATALAVIENPFSGRYEPDLMEFQSSLRELGRSLSARLVAAEIGRESWRGRVCQSV